MRRQETSEGAAKRNAASSLAQTYVVASRRHSVRRANSFVADFDKIYQLPESVSNLRQSDYLTSQQDQGRKSEKDRQSILDQQIGERVLEGQRQQGEEHSEPILLPIEGGPAVEAGQNGGVTVVAPVNGPKVDPGRGYGAQDENCGPPVGSVGWLYHGGILAQECRIPF